MQFIRLDRGAPYRKTKFTRWLEECAAWCAGGWQCGSPRLSSLLSRWQAFNTRIRTDKAKDQLKIDLVRFLFSHCDENLLLGTWIETMLAECLSGAFAVDPMLRDEVEAVEVLRRVCAPKAKLATMTVGAFGGQTGASDHRNLITLHSAKGMEFDVVIMMGLEQGSIPKWSAKTPEKMSEERRLFYVGLTRARHEVHLLYSGFTVNKKGVRYDNGPSAFVIEVRKKVKKQI
jgi:DNA helicase-2/ATP-dependent DNA helicase PcrA